MDPNYHCNSWRNELFHAVMSDMLLYQYRRHGVLVTGASGYLAIHCVQQLLQQGYKVRGTLRDLNSFEKANPLRQLANSDQLELFRVALEDDVDLWRKAIMDCTYVLHIASPCEMIADETIVEIAIRGTLNVLRGAAQLQCVRKINCLIIASDASHLPWCYCARIHIGYHTLPFNPSRNEVNGAVGHKNRTKLFTENDWTNLNWKYLHPYHRSKTLAEHTAWNFMEKNPDVSFSLTVLNPSLIVGPSLQSAKGSSVTIISRFMDGSMPAYPAMKLGLVDVRDAARAHILAMKDRKSNGQRILITAKTLSFRQIAKTLREEFAKYGYRIPRIRALYIAVWLYSLVDKEALQALSLYGHEDNFDNSKASISTVGYIISRCEKIIVRYGL
ncbi:oxidoreductase [Loa loa]|uniref:Oxidoreductase n=1 Tax=Loa loa TaxID=7209 RepID=A0A1S0TL12_LOALO|nr:oxidoreductase [Loa loa]EFO15961.2 oxidoreductase [Loa loa]